MKLTIATNNKNKIAELMALLRGMDIEVESLLDHPEIGEVEEDGDSFAANALIKAKAVQTITGGWVLADDSGLAVEALGGAPGIYSARYSGVEKDYAANNRKLLAEMVDVPDCKRSAAFVCVMALLGPSGEERVVEGRCDGVIAHSLTGNKGFGYDPLFYIPELGRTMAELDMSEKNTISHRGRALKKIKDVLLDILG